MAIRVEKSFIPSGGARFGERKPQPERLGNVPRISKLLILAMHYDKMMHERHIPDFNTLAKLAGVTKPQMNQIMNLMNLAPEIQSAILMLPAIRQSRDFFTERKLRPIAREPDWTKQREM